MSKKRVQLSSILMEYPDVKFYFSTIPKRSLSVLPYNKIGVSDEYRVVEATVADRLELMMGYKITLKPVNVLYPQETFYQDEFIWFTQKSPKDFYVVVDEKAVKLI